jgi:hypothetical protein
VTAVANPPDTRLEPYAVARKGSPSARRPPSRSRYSRTEIEEALREWARLFGEPPRLIDLDPARARRMGKAWRADRFEAGQWPTAKMVSGQFGSLTAALTAAGLPARQPPARTAANLTGPEAILDAIRQWVRRYGAVPALADWDPARARRLDQDWRIARYYRDSWPSTRTVIHHFGSMSAAVAAAGLPPRPVGSHGAPQANAASVAREAAVRQLNKSDRLDSGPDSAALVESLRRLATARRERDAIAVHSALIDVAGAALAWAERAGVSEA